jgi:hypothetical protein
VAPSRSNHSYILEVYGKEKEERLVVAKDGHVAPSRSNHSTFKRVKEERLVVGGREGGGVKTQNKLQIR